MKNNKYRKTDADNITSKHNKTQGLINSNTFTMTKTPAMVLLSVTTHHFFEKEGFI